MIFVHQIGIHTSEHRNIALQKLFIQIHVFNAPAFDISIVSPGRYDILPVACHNAIPEITPVPARILELAENNRKVDRLSFRHKVAHIFQRFEVELDVNVQYKDKIRVPTVLQSRGEPDAARKFAR